MLLLLLFYLPHPRKFFKLTCLSVLMSVYQQSAGLKISCGCIFVKFFGGLVIEIRKNRPKILKIIWIRIHLFFFFFSPICNMWNSILWLHVSTATPTTLVIVLNVIISRFKTVETNLRGPEGRSSKPEGLREVTGCPLFGRAASPLPTWRGS